MSPTIIGYHWDEYFCTIPFFSLEVTLEFCSFIVEIGLISVTSIKDGIFFTLFSKPEQAYLRRSGQPH